MLVSILHRLTGGALAVAELAVLTWWLWAIAAGPDAYGRLTGHGSSWFGLAVLVGLTWAFFQHLLSGIRQLVMDTGAGFELNVNKLFAVLTSAGSLFLTALTWFLVMEAHR